MYIGVNNVARKISNCYVGVNGVARKVKAVYIGDVNGVARLVWQSVKKKVSSVKNDIALGSITDSYGLYRTQYVYKVNDNHILIGMRTGSHSGKLRGMIYNCHLNDNGDVISETRYESSYEAYDSRQVIIHSICKLNDSYGACLVSNYDNSSSSNSSRILQIFNLDSCTNYLKYSQIAYGSLDSAMGLFQLNNDSVFYPYYGTSGYVFGKIFTYKNNEIYESFNGTLTKGVASRREPFMYGRCLAFTLSNNRFGVISVTNEQYVTATSSSLQLLVNIYSYTYDSSTIKMNTTNLANHALAWIDSLQYIIDIGDNYFVVCCYTKAFGFHIDANNSITLTNTVSGSFGMASRIGTSDSIYTVSSNYTASIIYYNKNNNTLEITYIGTQTNTELYDAPYKEQGIIHPVASGNTITFYKTSFD